MTNTPSKLDDYINEHINYELKYLLCATKIWKLIEENKIPDKTHIQVYAMTSVFVHSRNLYLFFTPQKSKSPHISEALNTTSLSTSSLFKRYKRTIESKVLHLNPIDQRRSKVSIKKIIVELTEDILRIVDETIKNLRRLGATETADCLYNAVKEASKSASIDMLPSYPLSEIFSSKTKLYPPNKPV